MNRASIPPSTQWRSRVLRATVTTPPQPRFSEKTATPGPSTSTAARLSSKARPAEKTSAACATRCLEPFDELETSPIGLRCHCPRRDHQRSANWPRKMRRETLRDAGVARVLSLSAWFEERDNDGPCSCRHEGLGECWRAWPCSVAAKGPSPTTRLAREALERGQRLVPARARAPARARVRIRASAPAQPERLRRLARRALTTVAFRTLHRQRQPELWIRLPQEPAAPVARVRRARAAP